MIRSILNAMPADTAATRSLVCIGGGTGEAPAPAVQTLDAEAELGARAGKGNWRELDSPLVQWAQALMRITKTETASVVTAKNDVRISYCRLPCSRMILTDFTQALKTTTANHTPLTNTAATTHLLHTTA
jgi:hypothetical protein